MNPFIPRSAPGPVLWQTSNVERREKVEDPLAQCLIDRAKDVAILCIGQWLSLPHFQEDRLVETSRMDMRFVVQLIDYQNNGTAHSHSTHWQRLGTYR